jgi:hypothetical protein
VVEGAFQQQGLVLMAMLRPSEKSQLSRCSEMLRRYIDVRQPW